MSESESPDADGASASDPDTEEPDMSTDEENAAPEQNGDSPSSPPSLGDEGSVLELNHGRPYVTVSFQGQLRVNTAAIREFTESEHTHVRVVMLEDDQKLLLQPWTEDQKEQKESEDMRFEEVEDQEGDLVFGYKQTLKYANVEFETTRRYDINWDDDLQAMVIDLSVEGEIPPGAGQQGDGEEEDDVTEDLDAVEQS